MKVSKEVMKFLENVSCFLTQMSKAEILQANRLQLASDKLKEKISEWEVEED